MLKNISISLVTSGLQRMDPTCKLRALPEHNYNPNTDLIQFVTSWRTLNVGLYVKRGGCSACWAWRKTLKQKFEMKCTPMKVQTAHKKMVTPVP